MNKNIIYYVLLFLALFLFTKGILCAETGDNHDGGNIRSSILAGTWYPKDRGTLTESIDNFLSRVDRKPTPGEIVAAIVPHAGHVYSGQVAAYAYRALEGMEFDNIIIMGPTHRFGFRGVSINLQSGYETPMGISHVNQDFANDLINSNEMIRYIPNAHSREHSIEIQLPFIQRIFPSARIIPVVMGNPDYSICKMLAESIVKLSGDYEKILIIASSDLSHFHEDKRARELDGEFIKQVTSFDPQALYKSAASGRCEACGIGPVITTLLAAKALGADRVEALAYANSGDVTGEKDRVVGYMSAVIMKSH